MSQNFFQFLKSPKNFVTLFGIIFFDAIKSFAFLCVAFGMILLIKDYNRRWIRSYENLKENPTLEKLTLFYYR